MTVVHHPRNHPGYTTCSCGHSVGQHSDKNTAALPEAAQGELTKCSTCNKRSGACNFPGDEGHLPWTKAYCPKCFTKPNPKGCKLLGSEGHWTKEHGDQATARASSSTGASESAPPVPAPDPSL